MSKRFPTTQNSESFPEFSQKSHFRHVVFYYSGAGKSVTFFPLFAGAQFGAQNAFLGPESHFGPQNAFPGPKMHFGVIFAPWPEMLMKPMVSASDFALFGVQMRKLALFRTLGPRNAK